MKYIIMADGDGKRWNNYLGIPKHLIEIDGEPILARTVRLLKENGVKDNDIIITARDERYTYAKRIPQTCRDCEIDRFEETLIDGPVCYLYGDVFYTNKAMNTIVETTTDTILYFGHEWEIFAIKVIDIDYFLEHKHKVKKLFLDGQLERCIGWEIYRSMMKIPFYEHRITDKYIKILDGTDDIDYPYEYEEWIKEKKSL